MKQQHIVRHTNGLVVYYILVGETKNSFPDSGNDPINLNSQHTQLYRTGEREREKYKQQQTMTTVKSARIQVSVVYRSRKSVGKVNG